MNIVDWLLIGVLSFSPSLGGVRGSSRVRCRFSDFLVAVCSQCCGCQTLWSVSLTRAGGR